MHLLKKGFNYISAFGFRETLAKTIESCSKKIFNIELESYYLFEKKLDKLDSNLKYPNDIKVLILDNSTDKIKSIVDFWPEIYNYNQTHLQIERKIHLKLGRGEKCFYAVHNDNIIGMVWINSIGDDFEKILKKIKISNHTLHLGLSYVSEAYRGKKIFPYINHFIFLHLKNEGIKEVYSFTGTSNISSIKSRLKMMDSCRLIYHLKIVLMGKQFHFIPKFKNRIIWTKQTDLI